MKISRYFDAAVLKPELTPEQAEAAIKECIAYDSYSVCVRGCDIPLAKRLCEGTNTKVSCVVEEEIRAVVEEAHPKGVNVKVIFETSQLDDAQIRKATEVCSAAGADFVKTSTGFNGGGATPEAIKAMLEVSAGRIKVKPSGGIRSYETARMYVDMGVDRLGIGFNSCGKICEGEAEALK